MFLFSGKKESGCKLVFDIGSGSVAGALVLVSQGHIPTVLYSFRSEIPFQQEANGQRLLSLMLRSLSQVVLTLCHEGFDAAGFGAHRPKIEEALVSFSAPWIASKTTFLRLQNKEPLRITEEVFSELLEHSEKDDGSSRSGIPKKSVPVERKLIKSVLNGYETSSPYGKEALDAEFTLFRSFSPPRIVEKVTDAITAIIRPQALSFHSFAFLLFEALRTLSPSAARGAIAADVSGEQTEILNIAHGTLAQTATFPFGRNRLIRILGRNAGTPPHNAESFLKLYVNRSGTGRLFGRVTQTLVFAEKEWGNEFVKTLEAVSGGFVLPKTFFVIADEDVLPIFTRAIAGIDFSQFAISPKNAEVKPITAEFLAPLVSWNAPQANDPFIGLVASFASRLRQSTPKGFLGMP